jgi:hypothetical protein
MSKQTANCRNLATVRSAELVSASPLRVFIRMIAVIVGIGAPSVSFAQTINLGAAGNFELLAVSSGNSPLVTSSADSISGNVGLGPGTQFNAASPPTYIGGNVYLASGVTGVPNPAVTIAGSVNKNADLSPAISAANTAYNTAKGYTTNTAMVQHSGSSYTITGTATENAYNFTTNPNLSGATITISGSSTQQFVFNFSNGLSLANSTIILQGGVTASNVFFNITGGSASITGTSFQGVLLDGSKGTVTLLNDVIHGEVIANGSITMSNTVMAPELPTITMAGLAGIFVMGSAGVGWLRKRQASVRSAGSPLP